jgi:hypothetical protein
VGSRTCDQAFFSTKAKDMPYLAPSIDAYTKCNSLNSPLGKVGSNKAHYGPTEKTQQKSIGSR